jgi:hypothetical protein
MHNNGRMRPHANHEQPLLRDSAATVSTGRHSLIDISVCYSLSDCDLSRLRTCMAWLESDVPDGAACRPVLPHATRLHSVSGPQRER